MPGDTTVFGWQMMALKSATMAGLDVPSPVITLGERFLDSVQSADGAYYGYMHPWQKPGPTAVGLLIRMYTGWQRDDARLELGTKFLAGRRAVTTRYVLQLLCLSGAAPLRRPTVAQVEREDAGLLGQDPSHDGHERGSWFFVDQHGSQGGRLYTTAMCAMILEVYYRHMPLYEEMAVGDDWW